MAVTSGFYNSANGDRSYNATQFSQFFDGLITDGVYLSFGNKLLPTPGTGLSVNIGSGRAWFDHHWIYNDATLNVKLTAADAVLSRIDAIVIDVNNSTDTRRSDIILVTGTPATVPDKPQMISTGVHKQYPIAYITVAPGATSISANDIDARLGTDDLPGVSALLELESSALEEIDQRFDRNENPVYTEATTLALPVSGEPATKLMGKIKKLFSALFAERDSSTVKFLRHDLTYATPPVVSATQSGYCPQRPAPLYERENGAYKYLRADGTWAVPPNTENNDAVRQKFAGTDDDIELKVLLSEDARLAMTTGVTKWDNTFTYNPKKHKLTVNKCIVDGIDVAVDIRKIETMHRHYVKCMFLEPFCDFSFYANQGDHGVLTSLHIEPSSFNGDSRYYRVEVITRNDEGDQLGSEHVYTIADHIINALLDCDNSRKIEITLASGAVYYATMGDNNTARAQIIVNENDKIGIKELRIEITRDTDNNTSDITVWYKRYSFLSSNFPVSSAASSAITSIAIEVDDIDYFTIGREWQIHSEINP